MRNTKKRTRPGHMTRLLLSSLVAFGTVLSLSVRLPNDVASAAMVSGTWQDITNGLPYNPHGIAVDSKGDLFVTTSNHIEELPSGQTAWTDITKGWSFSFAYGIAVDKNGNLFVTDRGNNTVEELPYGAAAWQNINHGFTSFSTPLGIAVDGNDNLYVTNWNNTIDELPGGTSSWQDITQGYAFINPVGVAADSNGNVFVVNYNGNGNPNTVAELPSGGSWQNITYGGYFTNPSNGIAVDSNGDVFVTSFYGNINGRIVVELPVGTRTWSPIPANGYNTSSFGGPAGIAVDSKGNLFVANSTAGSTNRVVEYVVLSPPAAPTNVSSSTTTTTSTTLSWSAVSGAQSYSVYENGGSTPIASGLTGTSYTVSGLSPGTQYSFTVTAENSIGPSSASTAVIVRTPVPPFSVDTTWAWDGQYGSPYNQLQLQAGWGPSPYTWSLNSGSLPDGLTLSTGGLISGTPNGPNGTSTFTVQAKDASGDTAYMTLSITISGAPALSITTSTLSSGREGQPYTSQLQGVGVAPLQWSLASGSLPRGLTLNAEGTISGTPTANGQFSFTVEAHDGSGGTVQQAYAMTVVKPPKGERIIAEQNYTEIVPAFVKNKTTYMPIWYVMQALKQAGVTSRWDGTNWRMMSQGPVNLTNIKAGHGNKNIYLNGTLVQRVDMTAATDPFAKHQTTYIPIWYAMHVLARLGLQSAWDGTTWTVSK